jgi:hypothetical protein
MHSVPVLVGNANCGVALRPIAAREREERFSPYYTTICNKFHPTRLYLEFTNVSAKHQRPTMAMHIKTIESRLLRRSLPLDWEGRNTTVDTRDIEIAKQRQRNLSSHLLLILAYDVFPTSAIFNFTSAAWPHETFLHQQPNPQAKLF